jgi:hypothetical protein
VKIHGYVEVEVHSSAEKSESKDVIVNAEDFQLSEGGDWALDRDEGVKHASFLYVAYLEGFSLHLSFQIHGSSISKLHIHPFEIDHDSVSRVTVKSENLDFDGLFPQDDVFSDD